MIVRGGGVVEESLVVVKDKELPSISPGQALQGFLTDETQITVDTY
jgi:hypothetical protein